MSSEADVNQYGFRPRECHLFPVYVRRAIRVGFCESKDDAWNKGCPFGKDCSGKEGCRLHVELKKVERH